MRKYKLTVLVLSLLFLTVSNLSAKSPSEFNACIQSVDCQHQCYYNTTTGHYNLESSNGAIETGTGVIASNTDNFILTDSAKGYSFKLVVDNATGYGMLVCRVGDWTISFSNYRQVTCSCL